MEIKINGSEIVAYPSSFLVTSMDLDNAESSVRTADGTLNRDRITIKTKIEMGFGLLKWSEISSILKSIEAEYFTVYYPDPKAGSYMTKTFYCPNKPASIAVSRGGTMLWSGLQVSLIEK